VECSMSSLSWVGAQPDHSVMMSTESTCAVEYLHCSFGYYSQSHGAFVKVETSSLQTTRLSSMDAWTSSPNRFLVS
jgi:hypothetical protein